MKNIGWVLSFGLVLLAFFATSTYAETPHEQLQLMVEQLQKTPADNALREKIIKFAISIKPAPAIPEDAREPFVMGATVLKKASDSAGASKAVDLFTQALNIAPWFADAYYNRAIAREAAGQYEPAIDDLELYLGFKLTDSERREAQDKIYALKAEVQLASSKKAEAAAKQEKADREKAAEADKFAWILGNWIYESTGPYARRERVQLVKSGDTIIESDGKLGKLRGTIQANGDIEWETTNMNVSGWLSVKVNFSGDRRMATISWPVPDQNGVISYPPEASSTLKRN